MVLTHASSGSTRPSVQCSDVICPVSRRAPVDPGHGSNTTEPPRHRRGAVWRCGGVKQEVCEGESGREGASSRRRTGGGGQWAKKERGRGAGEGAGTGWGDHHWSREIDPWFVWSPNRKPKTQNPTFLTQPQTRSSSAQFSRPGALLFDIRLTGRLNLVITVSGEVVRPLQVQQTPTITRLVHHKFYEHPFCECQKLVPAWMRALRAGRQVQPRLHSLTERKHPNPNHASKSNTLSPTQLQS